MSRAPVHVAARTGPATWSMGCMFRVLASSAQTGGAATTLEATVPPDEGANPHLHAAEDEQFYVLEGELVFEVAGRPVEVGPGGFLHVPRGVVHSFLNGPRQARLLVTFSPGTGIEDRLLAGGVPLGEEAAYGADEVKPPPGARRHRVD